jgi:uncharacterized protein with ParB-like and HNH nuclease domain
MSTLHDTKDVYIANHLSSGEQETELEEFLEEDDDILPAKFSISVSRIDFDVDGIVKRLRKDEINIPDFQRTYVWKPKQASRLIESLLLGLPVPGIFLSRELETNKLLVLDGQQRLKTLQSFYDGKLPYSRNAFSLRGVHQNFEGKTHSTLNDFERRQLDNSVISATVIQADNNNEESIYYIFERLNTGGTLLKPQEIRGCVYHGELNTLLEKLNNNSAWRKIYGEKDKNRRDQELILRFLALYLQANYKPSMKEFINQYMKHNRNLKHHSQEEVIKAFIPTIGLIYNCLGHKAFRPQKLFVTTFYEAVMVGLARRLEKGEIQNPEELKQRYEHLIHNPNFLGISKKRPDLTSEFNVKERMRMATETFADLH